MGAAHSGRKGRSACLSPVLHIGRDISNGDKRTSLTWGKEQREESF